MLIEDEVKPTEVEEEDAPTNALMQRVPNSVADLQSRRVTKAKLSRVDRLEPHVLAIWETNAFRGFLRAMDEGGVIEGSPRADDQEMARLCRNQAAKSGDKVVRDWSLDECRRALGAVMRRFASNRKSFD